MFPSILLACQRIELLQILLVWMRDSNNVPFTAFSMWGHIPWPRLLPDLLPSSCMDGTDVTHLNLGLFSHPAPSSPLRHPMKFKCRSSTECWGRSERDRSKQIFNLLRWDLGTQSIAPLSHLSLEISIRSVCSNLPGKAHSFPPSDVKLPTKSAPGKTGEVCKSVMTYD